MRLGGMQQRALQQRWRQTGESGFDDASGLQQRAQVGEQ
jgi:hypothetical protein